MIRLNIDYIFAMRGIKQKFTFIRKQGLSHEVSHRLANNDTQSINLRHLTKLCEVLHCTPNDLLDHSEDSSLPPNHPLSALKKDMTHLESLRKLQTLPPEKMDALKEWMDSIE